MLFFIQLLITSLIFKLVIQEIFTYLILIMVFIYLIRKIFRKSSGTISGCTGCVSDCNLCALNDLKKEIEKKR